MSRWIKVERRMTMLEYRSLRALFPAAKENTDPTMRCFERKHGRQCQRVWLHVGLCSFPTRSTTIRLDHRRPRRSNLWWRAQVASA